MIVRLAKWGDSLALRIPSAFANELAAHDGKLVELKVEGGSLIATPVDALPNYDLDELLTKITPENLHGEVSTGIAVGNELP
jgi:antitoxin MazE